MDWPQLCIHPALLTAPLVYVENIEGDGDDDGEQLDNDSDIDKYIDNDRVPWRLPGPKDSFDDLCCKHEHRPRFPILLLRSSCIYYF